MRKTRKAGIGAGLDRIGKALEKHNEIAQAAFDAAPKPEGTFKKVLETVVLIAGALAILNSADVIRVWITGG